MLKLTAAQKRAIQRLTNRIEQYYGGNRFNDDEVVHYKVAKGYAKSVILQASNAGSPWFCSCKSATLIIGERGGVQRKISMFDNMSSTLILD